MSLLPIAALLLSGQADPVAAAVVGLSPAEIEDDNGPDMPLVAMTSAGCRVEVVGRDARFAVDMTKVAALSLEDTFVFIESGPVRLAIVGDASKPDQAAKLAALATALTTITQRCTPAAK